MGLRDITKESVLHAIREFDAIGRDAFLEKYSFGPSRSYFLLHDGNDYDSKAIVGVAHGFARPDIGHFDSSSFTGGEKTVQAALERLGFQIEIKDRRNPNWTRDELIIALDYYFDHPGESHDDTHPGVIGLSEQINAVGKLLGLATSETFRNPAGVSMKLLNFRAHDPVYRDTGRVGLSRGNKLEKALWDEFSHDHARLKSLAISIRSWLFEPDMELDLVLRAPNEPEVTEAQEGRILTRVHRFRERDPKIIKRKKESFQKTHNRLFCEACGFDYSKAYGERGDGFIECHHTLPVSEMVPGSTTKLADLVLLCANCHRMVHVKAPWLTVSEIKAMLPTEA